jgi:squalene-hopene/tetraprenyl-beta-curcumene cyclase
MERGQDRMIANKEGGASRRASGLFSPRWLDGPDRATHDQIRASIGATRDWLLGQQHDEGYWVGELEGDTILESEYVLLMAFLGRQGDEVCVKACRYMLEQEAGGRSTPAGLSTWVRPSRRISPSSSSDCRPTIR